MILIALFLALFMHASGKFLESVVPLSRELSLQRSYRVSYFGVVDEREKARRELEYASQRVAVYLFQRSRRELLYEPSPSELWSFIGAWGNTGSVNLSGSTSSSFSYSTLVDGSFGRYLLRSSTLFADLTQYQYDYDLRGVSSTSTVYGYEDFLRVR